MNLYRIYSRPRELAGYDRQDLLPWNVYEEAANGVELNSAQLAVLALDPRWAYNYARYVVNGPWRPGEPVIAADPKWAYQYARNVIRGRWTPGEAAIATGPVWAYWYAYYVLGGPWPQGEAAMQQDPGIWRDYQQWVRLQQP